MSADRTGRRRFAPERTVLRLARPYLKRLTGAALLAAATDFAALALMATSTWLLISAAGRPPLDTLTVAIVSVRGLAISRGVLRYTERLAGHDAVLRYITDVRTRIFAGLVGRRADVSHRSGDALSRLVSDVEDVQNLLLRVVVPAAGAVLVGLSAIGCALLVSPAAAGVLAAGLLLAGVVLPLIAMRLTRHSAGRVAPLRAALAVDSIDLTHGAADLAAFGATDAALRAADGRARTLARVERRLAAAGFAVDGAGVLLAGGTAAAVVVTALNTGVSGVWIGVLGVATLSAVELTLVLVGAARHWVQVRGGVTRVAELVADAPVPDSGDPLVSAATMTAPAQTPPQPAVLPQAGVVPEPAVPVTAPGDGEPANGPAEPVLAAGPAGPPPSPRDFAVTDVEVRYRADAAPALDRVSLDLAAGRRVAVVGPSGAGKSTLLAVLTGAVRPDSGRVTADGTDLDRFPAQERPRLVTGLLAEAHVFHATVRENLLLGRAGAGDDELAAATAAAGLLDWVREQPDGWSTVVGEEGAQLSGGQRQRLALARALLAAPPLLLLDEPTEGLDPAAADAVLASTLAATPAGHTVLLVTHRLRGLGDFDEIVVLDAGRVVQRGRHAELVEAPGWYREQWLLQEAAERGYLALRR